MNVILGDIREELMELFQQAVGNDSIVKGEQDLPQNHPNRRALLQALYSQQKHKELSLLCN